MPIFPPRSARGFSLIELLVVIAIMGLLLSLTITGIPAILNAGGMNQAIIGISGVFEQARAYAQAHNTYVFIGLTEIDAVKSPTTGDQTAGIGRVVLAVVASQDGMASSASSSGGVPLAQNTNLIPISKIQSFSGIHLGSLADDKYNTGGMNRPGKASLKVNYLSFDASGSAQSDPGTGAAALMPADSLGFSWPLSGATAALQPAYLFNNAHAIVVQVSPQGVMQVSDSTENSGGVQPPKQYLELGLVPAHGNQIDADPKNYAAIQIEGITGAVKVYRP